MVQTAWFTSSGLRCGSCPTATARPWPPCCAPSTPPSTTDTALIALTEFADSPLGRKYPAAVASWENAWDRFTLFLAFRPALRKVIYTTNSIESLNYQLRKIIKNRGRFPNDAAAVKLFWLAIRNIEDKRARERAKEASRPKGSPRKAPAKLVEGSTLQGWKAALGELALIHPDRINRHL